MVEQLSRAGALVLIIAAGYLIKRRGWVDASLVGPLGKILVHITLPAAIITGFNTVEVRAESLIVPLVGFVVVSMGQVAGYLVARPHGRAGQALGVLNGGPGNIGLFVVPYLSTFAGPAAMVMAGLFDIGNALASIVVGYTVAMLLARGGSGVQTGRALLRTITMPVFVTYIGMVALRLAGINLPRPVTDLTAVAGAANTFLAMLMIGVGLQLVLDRRRYALALRILAARYALYAVVSVVVWLFLPLPAADRAVVIMCLAGPIASLAVAFTAEGDLDLGVTTFAVSVSVLISLVTLPLLGVLLL